MGKNVTRRLGRIWIREEIAHWPYLERVFRCIGLTIAEQTFEAHRRMFMCLAECPYFDEIGPNETAPRYEITISTHRSPSADTMFRQSSLLEIYRVDTQEAKITLRIEWDAEGNPVQAYPSMTQKVMLEVPDPPKNEIRKSVSERFTLPRRRRPLRRLKRDR